MSIIVQKFGGTSVGSIERIKHVADTVIKTRQSGKQVVVVVSAMGGATDKLIQLAKSAVTQPDAREYDVLVSTGEQVSMSLLAMVLIDRGFPAVSLNGLQAGIKTDSLHTKAHIEDVDTRAIINDLNKGNIIVVAGFQGGNRLNEITTLGRGGSDTTAVALAAALNAEECQIYTDVEGVYTTDPRVVSSAKLLPQITFEEMLEMAWLGAKVLQTRAVRYAGKFKVPLRVLSSFKDGPGTLITYEEYPMEDPVVSGIAFNRSEAKITLFGVPRTTTMTSDILTPITEANIDVDMILQNEAQNETFDFTFTVNREEYQRALFIIEHIAKKLGVKSVHANNKIAKLSIIGVGMRSHPGVANTMFATLAKEGIMVHLVATSEIKTSVVVDEKYLELGVRALHSAFNLDVEPSEEFDPVVIKA
jgi:aspartate kinase